jgi:hypothetical protein
MLRSPNYAAIASLASGDHSATEWTINSLELAAKTTPNYLVT